LLLANYIIRTLSLPGGRLVLSSGPRRISAPPLTSKAKNNLILVIFYNQSYIYLNQKVRSVYFFIVMLIWLYAISNCLLLSLLICLFAATKKNSKVTSIQTATCHRATQKLCTCKCLFLEHKNPNSAWYPHDHFC